MRSFTTQQENAKYSLKTLFYVRHFVTFSINYLEQQFGSDNLQSYNSSYKITNIEGSE